MKRALFLAACCSLILSACAATTVVPVTAAGFSGFESEEIALWKQADEQVERIDESGYLYHDPALETYLNAVARRLQSKQVYERIPFAVRILRDPRLSAFTLTNGAVYLSTGIIAAMENEAQLAALLGHEMTHATNRHSLESLREAKKTTAVMATVVLATAGFGSVFIPVEKATLYGYARDLEREADKEGFTLMERAGYDVSESIKLFEQLKREIEKSKIREPFFFSTHPRMVERIESYRKLVEEHGSTEKRGILNTEIFRIHVKQLVLDNAQLDIQFGRYEKAISALTRYIGRYPGEAEGFYLLGEANRQVGDHDHDGKAREYYEKALSIDPRHADSHKMLGVMLLKAGNRDAAKEHLERYLTLNTHAPDRGYVEGYLRACGVTDVRQ